MQQRKVNSRRLFLRSGLAAGALGGALLTTGTGGSAAASFTPGDWAILRFIAMNEMIAADIPSQLAAQVRFKTGFANALPGIDPLLVQAAQAADAAQRACR